MPVSFGELHDAFLLTSFGAPGENQAYLDRHSGNFYYHSAYGDNKEELPEDIDDEKYIAIPTKTISVWARARSSPLFVSSCRMITTKCVRFSGEKALTGATRPCWSGEVHSTVGTIFQTRPRKAHCGQKTGLN